MKGCEDNAFCKKIGGVGVSYFDSNRFYLMILAVFCAVLSFIFFCVGLAGSSRNEDNVIACNWANSEFSVHGEDYKVYFGTRMLVTAEEDGNDPGDEVDYDDCDNDFCEECEESGNAAIVFLLMAWILMIPLVIVTVMRFSDSRGTTCTKVTGVICSVAALIFVIIAMSSFSECYEELDDTDQDIEYGPAFHCLGVSILTLIISGVVHLLTSTTTAAVPAETNKV